MLRSNLPTNTKLKGVEGGLESISSKEGGRGQSGWRRHVKVGAGRLARISSNEQAGGCQHCSGAGWQSRGGGAAAGIDVVCTMVSRGSCWFAAGEIGQDSTGSDKRIIKREIESQISSSKKYQVTSKKTCHM